MKFAGVVVTYKRKEDLLLNIKSVLSQTRQLDMYYIIDNCSKDGTYEYLESNHVFDNKNVRFVELNENIGGAGGFYEGIKLAYEDGYDFICLMDDDGRPANNKTFEYLFKHAEDKYASEKKMMINSLVVSTTDPSVLSFEIMNKDNVEEVKSFAKDGIIKNSINPFNGTLISKDLIKEIGFPNKDFFIRGDEVDYQARAKRSGAYIATVVDSLYTHPKTELVSMKWRGRVVKFGIFPPWKGYYLIRNYVYRIKRDSGVIKAIEEFIFLFYGTIKCNKNGRKYLRLLFRGFRHGMRGKLGILVKPGQTK